MHTCISTKCICNTDNSVLGDSGNCKYLLVSIVTNVF